MEHKKYPFIIKFMHSDDGEKAEEMFLCLHARDLREAQELFVRITDGTQRGNALVSVTGPNKIEVFWDASRWTFFTIPPNE